MTVLPRAMANEPWRFCRQIGTSLSSPLLRRQVNREAIAAVIGGRSSGGASQSGSVAILPVFGLVSHRPDPWQALFGGVSCEWITRALRLALADGSVGAVLLVFDTPGGEVPGVPELASEIYRARRVKPVISLAIRCAPRPVTGSPVRRPRCMQRRRL